MLRRKSVLICVSMLVLGFVSTGCHTTRGVMYIKPDRVGKYIKQLKEEEAASAPAPAPAKDGKNGKDGKDGKDGKAPAPAPAQPNEAELQKRYANLENVPDGNRILGGFCTDPAVKNNLFELQKLEPKCSTKVNTLSKQAKTQGILYWTFLGLTTVSGAGMVVGGVAAPSDVAGPLALGFGIATLTFAVVNGVGGFDGRQERLKLLSSRLDNYMWSLRMRIMFEVCNAKTVELARTRLKRIMTQAEMYCSEKPDDGTYHPPK